MRTTRAGKNIRVLSPSWRFDIRREVDLIEELARVHGYEKLPSTRPQIEMSAPSVPEGRVSESRLRATLVDRDYQEVITYSFVDPKLQALLDPATAPLMLANPISVEMAAMRTTLWPGLIQTILYNQNRQQARLRIFEIGRRFIPAGLDLNQEPVLAGAVTGSAYAEQWGVSAREVDFHDGKADLEALFTHIDRHVAFRFKPVTHPVLHPGCAAQILKADTPVGLLGTLHPELQAKLSLDRPVILFEIALTALTKGTVPAFREISKFPTVRRDLSFWLPEQVQAEAALDCAEKVAGNLLVNLELFDQYHGKGIDSGRKSFALGLTLQDSSRTLKEHEIDAVVARVISALQTELGAQLRG
jgi:phenylalanyl-tRNA synthetase beta chain